MPTCCLAGLSHWLVSQIQPLLEKWPHILMGTDQVIERVSNVTAGRDDFFVKIDIRDFFLSGEHHDLVEAVLLGFEMAS